MNFNGKRALVTGAAGGIGTAIVRLLREAGASAVFESYVDHSRSYLSNVSNGTTRHSFNITAVIGILPQPHCGMIYER